MVLQVFMYNLLLFGIDFRACITFFLTHFIYYLFKTFMPHILSSQGSWSDCIWSSLAVTALIFVGEILEDSIGALLVFPVRIVQWYVSYSS